MFNYRYIDFIINIGISYVFLIIIYSFLNFKSWYINYNYIIYLIISIFIISMLIKLKSLEIRKKVNITLLLVSSFITIYGIELSLNIMSFINIKNRYDNRSIHQVILDFKEDGIIAYPSIYPTLLLETNNFMHGSNSIFPLSGISKETTVLGNENGYWAIYESDQYGFNNTIGSYDQIDVALIGDSFGEGKSVMPLYNIQSQLLKNG